MLPSGVDRLWCRKGAKGRHTATGHIPEHAKVRERSGGGADADGVQMAMDKKKLKWKEENKRLKALRQKQDQMAEE